MIAGHFATALIPYELLRKKKPAPFWLLLLASQFLDFLMLFLVLFGLEKLEPTNFFDTAFALTHSEMLISHDILPLIGWTILFGLAVLLFTKRWDLTIWCMILVAFHEVLDLIVGFEHFILGPETKSLGLNLYNKAPITGLIIEAILCIGIIYWLSRKRAQDNHPISGRLKWGLYLTLVGSTLATCFIANRSINSWFNF